MKDFVKLFNTAEHGQILVVINESPDDPSIEADISFTVSLPSRGLCKLRLEFCNDEEKVVFNGAERARAFFDELGAEYAAEAALALKDAGANSGAEGFKKTWDV